MAIDFPASPSLNDTFTSGGVTYTWDGTVWAASGSAAFVQKAGDTFTGNVEISTGIDLNTDGSAAFAGSVGIGTTSPDSALHVTGAIPNLTVENGGDDTVNRFVRFNPLFQGASGGSAAFIRPSGGTAADVKLSLRLGGSTTTEEIVSVHPDGKVGVNKITPAVALDVTGEIRASTGVLFGTDTAAANTLDDYEEGTWTPEFAGDGGTLGSYTYSVQSGTYTRVGNLVTAICYLENITQVSAGNEKAQVTGLPFANGDSYEACGPVTLGNFAVDATTTYSLTAHVASGASAVKFRRSRESAGAILVPRVDFTDGSSDIWFSITYRVA